MRLPAAAVGNAQGPGTAGCLVDAAGVLPLGPPDNAGAPPHQCIRPLSMHHIVTVCWTLAIYAPKQIMDLLGFEPSPWNKINIHIGG